MEADMEANMQDMEVEQHGNEEQGMDVEMSNLEAADALDNQQYLQAPQISGQDINDWINLPEIPERRPGELQSVANIYRSSFTIIRQAWGCAPAECLPEEFRLTTSYSLALVSRLAELALRTPGRKDEAHAMLFKVSAVRFAPPGHVLSTELGRRVYHKRYLEHTIKEHANGLLILDVEEARVHFSSTVPKAPTESRADRAARRLASGPSSREAAARGQSQQRDREVDMNVGDGVRGRGKDSTKKGRKRMMREVVLYQTKARRGEDTSTQVAAIQHMFPAAGNGDHAMDTSNAPPNSPHEGAAMTPQKQKQMRKQAKKVDNFMSKIFDGIRVDQAGNNSPQDGRPQEPIKIPKGLGLGLTQSLKKRAHQQRNSDPTLPLERLTIINANGQRPLPSFTQTSNPSIQDEGI